MLSELSQQWGEVGAKLKQVNSKIHHLFTLPYADLPFLTSCASSAISFRVNVEPLCRSVACSSDNSEETILLLDSYKAFTPYTVKGYKTVLAQQLCHDGFEEPLHFAFCAAPPYNMHGARPVMAVVSLEISDVRAWRSYTKFSCKSVPVNWNGSVLVLVKGTQFAVCSLTDWVEATTVWMFCYLL